MKKLAKLISLICVIAISATVLTGCGSKGKIKKTIEGYQQAVLHLDNKEAVKYLSEDYPSRETIENFDIVGMYTSMLSSGMDDDSAEKFAKELDKLLKDVLKDVEKTLKIEYKDFDIEDDEAIVEVKLTMADPTEALTVLGDTDKLSEAIEDVSKYEMEDLDDLDDKKQVDILIKAYKKLFKEVNIKKADTTTETTEYTLEKEKGKWLIVSES